MLAVGSNCCAFLIRLTILTESSTFDPNGDVLGESLELLKEFDLLYETYQIYILFIYL